MYPSSNADFLLANKRRATDGAGSIGREGGAIMEHNFIDEPDIGSGEKTPAELETEEQIRQIPPLPPPQVKPASEEASAPAPR